MSRVAESYQNPSFIVRFKGAAAEDLRFLVFLHNCEPDAQTLAALREQPFQQWLGITLKSQFAGEALEILDGALRDLPEPIDMGSIDALGVDYANIYLTYAYRASPSESVWFDDDGLERQEPMFRVRGWYRKHGVAISDPMKRADDHLVFQLQFVARLLDLKAGEESLRKAAGFMDEHLLRWLGQFCGRVASRCGQPYFAGLALLTAAYLEELRENLAEILGEARPSREEIERRLGQKQTPREATSQPHVPGAGPGW